MKGQDVWSYTKIDRNRGEFKVRVLLMQMF